MRKLRAKKIKHLEGERVFLVFRVSDGGGIRLVATRLSKVFNDKAIFEGNCHVRLGNIIRLVQRAQDGNHIIFSRGYGKKLRTDFQKAIRRLIEGAVAGKEVEVCYIKNGEERIVKGILDQINNCGFVRIKDGTIIHFLDSGEVIRSINFIEPVNNSKDLWHTGCYEAPRELVPTNFKVTDPNFIEELRHIILYLTEEGISVLSEFGWREQLSVDFSITNKETYSVRVVPETVD
jgi:hypothetical protein